MRQWATVVVLHAVGLYEGLYRLFLLSGNVAVGVLPFPRSHGSLPVHHLRLAYSPPNGFVVVAEVGGADVVLSLTAIFVHLIDRWFLKSFFYYNRLVCF